MIKKGDKYNKLTAIRFIERKNGSRQYWLFKCDCGNEKIIEGSSVKVGSSKSCGCSRSELKNNFKHGMTNTRIYGCWNAMKNRCLNKNTFDYKHYGERGITVCEEWLDFENFYADMGEMPENKTLDRKDNSGNYCKENCRWATHEEQMNNTRRNHFLTYNGKTQTLAQWAKELDINYCVITSRAYYNWSIEKILTTPVRKCKPTKNQEQ